MTDFRLQPPLDEGSLVKHFAELAYRNVPPEEVAPALGEAAAARVNAHAGEALLRHVEAAIAALTGMDTVTVELPTAEHAAIAALLVVRAFHEAHGGARKVVLIAKSAPLGAAAAVRRAGYEPVAIESERAAMLAAPLDRYGRDIAALYIGTPDLPTAAALAATAESMQSIGARLFADASGWASLHGYAKPRDLGIDIVALDLRRLTCGAGGEAASGAVAARSPLAPFVPGPRPDAIGEVGGTAARLDRLAGALAYFLKQGTTGLKANAELSALAACYLRKQETLRRPTAPSGRPSGLEKR